MNLCTWSLSPCLVYLVDTITAVFDNGLGYCFCCMGFCHFPGCFSSPHHRVVDTALGRNDTPSTITTSTNRSSPPLTTSTHSLLPNSHSTHTLTMHKHNPTSIHHTRVIQRIGVLTNESHINRKDINHCTTRKYGGMDNCQGKNSPTTTQELQR